MRDCKNCIHINVCALCSPTLPVCDDYLEVVHCKDCKYFSLRNKIGTQGICNCNKKDESYYAEFYPFPDDFCSYGERKE